MGGPQASNENLFIILSAWHVGNIKVMNFSRT